jgi:hypothetical protein
MWLSFENYVIKGSKFSAIDRSRFNICRNNPNLLEAFEKTLFAYSQIEIPLR